MITIVHHKRLIDIWSGQDLSSHFCSKVLQQVARSDDTALLARVRLPLPESQCDRAYGGNSTDPHKVLKSGPGFGEEVDPLPNLERELSKCRVAQVPGLRIPPMTGGAIGYACPS